MVEELGAVLRSGFETWKKNLVICLPFVLSMVLTVIVTLLILGATLLAVFGPLISSVLPVITETGAVPPEVIGQLQSLIIQHLGVIMGLVLLTAILALLISTYFTAGAIGMAKEATEQGTTSLTAMTAYGRRKFLCLLVANVILGLITLAGVVFLIPGIISLLPAISTSPLGIVPDVANFAAVGIGLFLLIIYLLLVSIIFAMTPYAVVIDDLGAVEGVKKGFHFFRVHKLNVFLLWLVVLVLGIVIGLLLGNIPTIGQVLSMAVSILVLQPLSVIWWSRLYLSGKAPAAVPPEASLLDDALRQQLQ